MLECQFGKHYCIIFCQPVLVTWDLLLVLFLVNLKQVPTFLDLLQECFCTYLSLTWYVSSATVLPFSTKLKANQFPNFCDVSFPLQVPEMNEVAEEASKVSWQKAVQTLILQNVGMLSGVTVLYMLARYQDHITFS